MRETDYYIATRVLSDLSNFKQQSHERYKNIHVPPFISSEINFYRPSLQKKRKFKSCLKLYFDESTSIPTQKASDAMRVSQIKDKT